MHNNVKLERVKALASKMGGDPHSVFYGDVTVTVDPDDAAAAIGHDAAPAEVASTAIVNDSASETEAARTIAAYNAMTDTERAARTLLPPLACWNAMVIINPMLGKVLSKALDYMLLKTLNEYPFAGATVTGVYDEHTHTTTVTIDSTSLPGYTSAGGAGYYIALPFFRFSIAASTLNAAPGSQIQIDMVARDAQGRSIDTRTSSYTYSFQRLNSVEAVVGVYIPTQVVATRTLPFLPIAGDAGMSEGDLVKPETITITFRGIMSASDQVTVTIPGYATAELKEIAAMYNLPSGMIR